MDAKGHPHDMTPWAIGAAHWDQRDLYTRDARVGDPGYGHGPSVHPEIGSYAYTREPSFGEAEMPSNPDELLELEAWPTIAFVEGEREERAPPTRLSAPPSLRARVLRRAHRIRERLLVAIIGRPPELR